MEKIEINIYFLNSLGTHAIKKKLHSNILVNTVLFDLMSMLNALYVLEGTNRNSLWGPRIPGLMLSGCILDVVEPPADYFPYIAYVYLSK